VSLEFIETTSTGSDGKHFGIDRSGAFNIQRCIADDEDFVMDKRSVQNSGAAGASDSGDLVAFFMIIRKCASLESIPQAGMPQLDLSTQTNISRKETQERRVRRCFGSGNEVGDSSADLRDRFLQNMVEPKDVFCEEPLKILRRQGCYDNERIREPG
jgi:hypothetical protein